MGLADVVPGVSGGTLALMFQIHPRLVAAIHALDRSLLVATLGFGRDREACRAAWQRADVWFLLWLGIGIAGGIVAGSTLLAHLIETYPVPLSGFFFGLILVGAWVPYHMMERRRLAQGIAFVAGALPAFWLTTLQGLEAPGALWFLPIAGAIALCAMILPGISGAFLLLLMGLYAPLLDYVRGLDVVPLALFALGGAAGLLSFSRLLHHLLTTHRSTTLALLTGLMVGSLGRVWPFRDTPGLGEGLPVAPGLDAVAAGAFLAAVAGGASSWLLVRIGQGAQETSSR